MGAISDAEVTYIRQGFEDGIRNDGRSPLQHRPISLVTGVLQQSSGSARCQLGSTEVLVSVKVGLLWYLAPCCCKDRKLNLDA